MSPEIKLTDLTNHRVSIKTLKKELNDLLTSNYLYKPDVSLTKNPKTKESWSSGMNWIIHFASEIISPGDTEQTDLYCTVLKWLLGTVLLDYLSIKTDTMGDYEGAQWWFAGLLVIEQYLGMNFRLERKSRESVLSAIQNKGHLLRTYKVPEYRSDAIVELARNTTKSSYLNTYRPKGVELLAKAFYTAFHRKDAVAYFNATKEGLGLSIKHSIDSWVALQKLINAPELSRPMVDVEQQTTSKQLLYPDDVYTQLLAQMSSQEALLELIVERLPPSVEAEQQLQEQQTPSKDFLRKLLEENFPSAEVMQELIKERLSEQKSMSNKEVEHTPMRLLALFASIGATVMVLIAIKGQDVLPDTLMGSALIDTLMILFTIAVITLYTALRTPGLALMQKYGEIKLNP